MRLSSGSAGDGSTPLVVPIDVVAVCLGETDAVDAAPNMAGATAAFNQQVTPARQAFLGANVEIGFDAAPWHQLEQGVHLHWALPDALTHAAATGGKLDFPVAPNRWLVTRIAVQGGAPVTRSWLVESDAVLAAAPAGQAPVTVPVSDGTFTDQDFGWLGRAIDIDGDFDAAAVEPAVSVAQATGTELTAVTTGEVHFAAYYPSSRSVFGFHDPVSDIAVPQGESVPLTYSVIGWYDDPSKDPLATATTLADLQAKLQWTYADGTATPTFSVYSGQVGGIAWSPLTSYQQATLPPVEAAAAIGTTSAQALAAYFANLDHPDIPLAETLLDAFQNGLLDAFTQPQPDQLTALGEALHDRGFGRAAAGLIYTVAVPDPGKPHGGAKELVDLPPKLAADLNLLNDLREQAERCQAHMEWHRWQVFADWYRIFEAGDDDTQNDAVAVAEQRVYDWQALSQACTAAQAAVATQLATVQAQLLPPMVLREVPGAPYVQPTDPVVMLTGEGTRFPERHGGDGRYDPLGLLACRLGGDLLSAIAAAGTTVEASAFTAVAAPGGLPYTDVCTALLREACLLDTALLAASTGVAEATLEGALTTALEGDSQQVVQLTGTPPSPVGVSWLAAGDWLPIFISWTVDYLPFQATESAGNPAPYPPDLVNSTFVLDQDAGGTLTPRQGVIDPSQASYPQSYSGSGTLTPSAAAVLETLLEQYLQDHPDHPDPSLQAIAGQLAGADYVTAPLAGLTELMLMRRHGLQLNVAVPATAPYSMIQLTQDVVGIVGHSNTIGPALNLPFNPLRAGYLRVTMELVDAYGRKRAVQVTPPLVRSQELSTPVSSTAYLAPRLSQPSRLLFRWLAADGTGLDEMNAHPATTPICGWLQPNRLDGSLFVYSADGKALGTLFLERTATGSQVGWQSAPGDDRTIDDDVATALQDANAQLRALAVSLCGGSADFFTALWRVLDTVADTVEAGTPSSNTGMAALVGHPVALAQALIRVELQGAPMLDEGWDAFDNDEDEGLTGLELPVVLGDLQRLSDGLVGWFGPGLGPYDLGTFYSQAADAASASGVVRPVQDTLTVTPTPKPDVAEPADLSADTRTVLMILDPAAPVHATTGVLPTASLQLPPDLVGDALSTLDMSFFTAPVLRGASELALPVPSQAGYAVSWVEEDRTPAGTSTWTVTPDIGSPAGRAVWPYTPQTVTEGWLRLNPIVLEFDLLDSQGRPLVQPGVPNSLALKVTNTGRRAATFEPCTTVPEGIEATGSIFYVHLGALVAPADIANVTFNAPGWAFAPYTDKRYGTYWAAAPTQAATVPPGGSIAFAVGDLVAAAGATRAHVAFDYYGVDGMDDGVFVEIVAVQAAPETVR